MTACSTGDRDRITWQSTPYGGKGYFADVRGVGRLLVRRTAPHAHEWMGAINGASDRAWRWPSASDARNGMAALARDRLAARSAPPPSVKPAPLPQDEARAILLRHLRAVADDARKHPGDATLELFAFGANGLTLHDLICDATGAPRMTWENLE